MRTFGILAQCLPGLLPHDKASNAGACIVSERDLHLSIPAVEVVPSKNVHPYKYVGEKVDMHGLYIFKRKITVSDIVGHSSYEILPSKIDGSSRSWESSNDLVNILRNEIRDGQLSFRGKRVLELGCGYGLAGIFACLKGACTVHFQDLNADTIRCSTIPNVLANLEQAKEMPRLAENPLTPSRLQLTSDVHFYAGDWEELDTVLSVIQPVPFESSRGASPSFNEDDFMNGCSSQDGGVTAHDNRPRSSRKLSGSRAWERASDSDPGDGGYDIILVSELPRAVSSLRKLHVLITKCLRPSYGVLYLAVKRHFVGSSGIHQLQAMIDEEGIFGAHVILELTDKEIWKLFFK